MAAQPLVPHGKTQSDRISTWLTFVEGHTTPESLAFLKLCFYSKVDYGYYEAIKNPTNLFNHLLDHCYGDNEMTTLQAFVNALKHLGNDLRGNYLVECMPQYEISCPPSVTEEMLSNEEKFCLCLVKIGVKSRGLLLENKLMKHFCRPKNLNMDYRNLQNLPDLFVRLMQSKRIRWNETKLLVYVFNKYRAQQCLKYLNQYYKKVGLPLLSTLTNTEDASSSSSPKPSALDDTSDEPNAKERKALFHRQPRRLSIHLTPFGSLPKVMSVNQDPRDIVVSTSARHGDFPHDESSTSGTDSSSEEDSGVDGKLIPRTSKATSLASLETIENSRPTRPCCSKRRKCCCFSCLSNLLFCLILLGALFGTVWFHLIKKSHVTVQGKEGTVIVLEEISQFFVQTVNMYEYLPLVTEPHTVGIYRYGADCDHIPINGGKTDTLMRLTNLSNVYFLKGTHIEYTLTLHSSAAGQYISVYLTTGLQTVPDFNPHQLHEQDIICHDRAFFDNTPHHCVHQVPKANYYNLNFLLPFPIPPTNYSLQMTYDNHTITVSELELVCTITDETDCTIDFDFTASKSCLLGNILTTENASDPFLAVNVDTRALRLGPVLGITLTLFALAVTLSTLILVICVCKCY